MNWLVPSLVATLIGTFVLSLLYVYLYVEYRERYLGIWSGCWSVYTLQLLLAIGSAFLGGSKVLETGYHLFSFVSGTLLYWGAQEFAGGRLSRPLMAGFALSAAWVVPAAALGLPFLVETLPLSLFLGGVYIWTGLVFLRMREFAGAGRTVASWALIVWGIHKFDYPFLRPVEWFAPWGFLIAATLSLFTAIGTILLFFQKTRIALSQSEERFRLLAENARDVIFRYRLRPREEFEYISPSVSWLTGYEPEEFYRDPGLLNRIVHPDDLPIEEAMRRSPRKPFTELRGTRKDGSERWVELRNVPLRDGDGELVAVDGIARDITERKLLENQLLQSQKMEAIGRLAGGVAHDFNNLLTAINGYADIVCSRTAEDDPRYREVEEIRKAGNRAASLTRQLLAFSRRQVLHPRVLDLNDLVANLSRMLRRLIGDDVELLETLSPDLGRVKADPGQIEQVLLNLAVNARDAMPRGGALTISTANVEEGESLAGWHIPPLHGPHVAVTVADTGFGMDEQTVSRMFEPFFTTKEPGKGTGLGLATVYGIVNQSGGTIGVQSEPGRGTSFRFFLPRVDEPLAEHGEEETFDAAAAGETVLVVEDEESVRTLVCEVLRRNGYEVLSAAGGDEAVEKCTHHPGPIHMTLTDVVMPGMNGHEVANRLLSLHPEMAVLYTSGYTPDAIVHHGVLDEGTAFLQKPFTPDGLARKVREVLDGKRPRGPRSAP